MGHTRIGSLPATRRWKDVIGIIAEGAQAAKVAEATTHAWELAFNKVRDDVGFREAIWLLTQLGIAGKNKISNAALSGIGGEISKLGSVVEVAMALNEAMEQRMVESRQRSDFGELAQKALVAAVTERFQKDMPTLLPSSTMDIGAAMVRCGVEKGFGELARSFFARMTNECLNYFLSKTLPAQVGDNRRFPTAVLAEKFEGAMETHCNEAAEIVETYSGQWLTRNFKDEGGMIGRELAENFGWYGMEKIRQELEMRARESGK